LNKFILFLSQYNNKVPEIAMSDFNLLLTLFLDLFIETPYNFQFMYI